MEYIGAVASLMQCFCKQECLGKLVSKQFSYFDKPQAILARLDEEMRVLNARETDVRQTLHVEMVRHGMEPKAEVKLWLENVHKITESVNRIKQDNVDDKRCIRCFPSCYFRLKLGNVVDEKIHEINKLLEQGKFSGSLVVDKLPKWGKTLPATTLMGETAQIHLKRIWEYIMDEDNGTIGVFGMGGVGKTTIMMEIYNRLVEEKTDFDCILWVTASRESNLLKLQDDIGQGLGLCFNNNENAMTRSAILCETLMRQKKCLLIIDDLWEAFSVEDVGIPNRERSKICKLVITTRSLTVCRGMETVKEVEVKLLSTEEAWDLFKCKVGEQVVSSLSIEHVAKDIAKECGGLPLAIATVGRSLRKEYNVKQWRIALRELRNSTANIEGMEKQVFARLRFSYERLKDDITRSCFLYCALYPKDHHIAVEEVIRYWIHEGLLGNLGDMESKMQGGYIILNELKNACMLDSVCQEGSTDEHVKMHDLIRDMALALTRVNPLFMVRAGQGIRLPPAEDEWHPDLERVSLMRNDLCSLDFKPRCPKLSTLFLQYNSISKGIGASFFHHMLNLRVLDLSYTAIHKLPDSFSALENLHALHLSSCWNLSHVPTLANLKELRVLDLSYSSIGYMPEGMETLVNLRRLDLTYSKVIEFSYSVLLTYKMLENLLLIGLQWSIDARDTSISALESCVNLSQLEVNFRTFEDFNCYIMSSQYLIQLESFKFCIGVPDSSVCIGKNGIAFIGVNILEGESLGLFPGVILELVLLVCSGYYFPNFLTIASSQVRSCKLQHCYDMECIIHSGWNAFPNLEQLKVEGLSKLNVLCMGVPHECTLANLTVLHVSECNNLKTLLSFELVQNLKKLEKIVIENCERIEEIIGDVRGDEENTEMKNAKIILPGLRKLRLSSLPSLISICSSEMVCDSLSTIEVSECPKLKALPFFNEIRQPLINSLKHIKGSRSWLEELKKNHPDCIRFLDSHWIIDSQGISDSQGIFEHDDGIGRHSFESGNSSFGPR